ncbi:hypothetical protein MNBD_UNCLBAC01-1380 [hydrothermal vent metagenome]|uniref:POTRA domain-containing protein n=1 Tax=hydrothermal vent metagenome TaxID=652676 RepID=A0A3B1E3N5_9ZZZZ
MLNAKYLGFLTVVFLFLSFSSVVAQAPSTDISNQAKIVKAIDIQGNKTISMATILAKIKMRVGQEYMEVVISDDLKRLYNTGYFSDIRVDRQDYEGGFKVIIYLEEKLVIEEITFSKTRYLKVNTLRKKITTQVGKFLDKKILKDDVDLIKDLYAKKGFTTVKVEVETFVDEITNKVNLHFIIKEGHRVRVKRIHIQGNDFYKARKILRLIKTKKKWAFNSGSFREEVMEEDLERIISFYEQQGFIDVKAEYSTERLYKGLINIDINLHEGKRYFVGDVAINGNNIVSKKEIQTVMKEIQDGGVFSREKLTVDIANIRTLYFDRGYIFANVSEAASLDPETGKVGVKIDINEGGIAYIEKIKIQGNSRTRDIVIRRELRMHPGDRFDGTKLRRSKERLTNLGYFEDVNFDMEDTDYYDRKDLVVQVKEAKTGSFSFGGGFSTVDQVVGFIEIEQRNFDITNWPTFTGGGQNLQLRAETGSTKNNLLLSFTEPWIFDYPVSGGFDLFRRNRIRSRNVGYAYDEERIGGNVRFGKLFTEYTSGNIYYKFEEVTIENFENNVSSALLAEAGTNRVSQIGTTIKRDSRNSVFSPTKGFVVSGSFDVAGNVLGGNKDFYRTQVRGSYYIPLKFKSVLEFRIHTGIVAEYGDSDKVPIFERFFAGGARTIRGYDERKVGPQDTVTNDPIGGESIAVANIEYTIPIIEFLKLAVFFDTGNVWADSNDFGSGDFKSGTGLGVRVKTPIGPVNLDYGYPLNDEPGEDRRSGKFYFSVSRGF